jgi:hypothetical protein
LINLWSRDAGVARAQENPAVRVEREGERKARETLPKHCMDGSPDGDVELAPRKFTKSVTAKPSVKTIA